MRKNAIAKRIQRDELKSLIRNVTFTKISKQYDVSINAVKGWCKYYNLPFRKEDIKLFNDTEWEKL